MIYIKRQIWELAKLRAMRNIEWQKQFQNFQFLEPNLDFRNWKTYRSLLIFKVQQFQKFAIGKFQECPIWKISKIVYLENSKNLQLWKFANMSNLESCKNFQFEKFREFLKFHNFENHRISEIVVLFRKLKIRKILQLGKWLKFHKFPLLWIIKYFYCSNNLNKYIIKKFEITKIE